MSTKHIHLEVPARQYAFMLKLLRSLPFVQIQESAGPAVSAAEQRVYDNVAQGFRELRQQREGKLTARPIEAILDELDD